MHGLALLTHYFKSVTCVYSVMFSLQRRCTGCRVPFSDPRCFLPVTVYGTTHAHLVHMYLPLLWGLRHVGRSFATSGTYTVVGSLQWIMRVLNSQGSRLHPSLQSRPTLPPCPRDPKRRHSPHSPLHLCSVCFHQWRVPQFALEYPCNPPPPPSMYMHAPRAEKKNTTKTRCDARQS